MDNNSLGSANLNDLGMIDIESLDEGNEQTWLHCCVHPGLENVDIQEWKKDSLHNDLKTLEYRQNVADMLAVLENMELGSNKQRFDSRTYTRPKKKTPGPSLYSAMPNYGSAHSNSNNVGLMCGTRTITKHSRVFADEGRHAKANTNTIAKYRNEENATMININGTFADDGPDDGDFSASYIVSKPIDINLSEPAHNLHNTFNKFVNAVSNRNNSIANMSPPSLVSSIAMDDSGAFNSSNLSRQGSVASNKSVSIKENEDFDGDGKTVENSMDISILDEKEMSTSMLSHCLEDNLIGSSLPSMTNSMESSLITSATFSAPACHGKNIMESSLVNSGTFNSILEPIDDKLPNGQPKFQLRKSFLKPDPEDNFDKFLVLNANCNTDDLRGLSGDFMKNARSKYDTYKKGSEKENLDIAHNKDDSFLMGDGMSESFVKETGRESINITYNKLPSVPQRVRAVNRPQIEMEPTILLPNQVLSPRHQNIAETNSTFTKKLNGTYDAITKERESPKRNATFRKVTPPSTGNITTVVINSENPIECKDAGKCVVIDSNKEGYNIMFPVNSNDKDLEKTEEYSPEEANNTSESPHHVPPLNMDDLEHLAYEQEQKLYQVVSTPISKPIPHNTGSADILFSQNVLSPIHNHGGDMMTSSSSSNISDSPTEPIRYGYNVSSLGSLNRLNASPKRSLPVKRESSAPEIKSSTPNYNSSRMPFSQKLGVNKFQSGRTPVTHNNYDAPDEGLYTSRSAGGSPAKSLGLRQSGLDRPLSGASPQLTGSDNELRLRKSGLPASKLRQYSSHKELNRIPGTARSCTAGSVNTLRPSSRLSFYASNPVLCPKPLVRQASYTIVSKDGPRRDFVKPTSGLSGAAPQSTVGGMSYGQPLRARHSIGISLPGGNRPSKPEILAPPNKPTTGPISQSSLKSLVSSAAPQKMPRPSGLPRPASGIPKRPSIRPPSSYSLAPKPNDQADCY